MDSSSSSLKKHSNGKPANQQTRLPGGKLKPPGKPANQQTGKLANWQTGKPAKTAQLANLTNAESRACLR